MITYVGLLDAWVRPRKLGFVFESNGGFEFPDGDKRAPDEPAVLGEDAVFEVPELLPGFSFPIGELWPE